MGRRSVILRRAIEESRRIELVGSGTGRGRVVGPAVSVRREETSVFEKELLGTDRCLQRWAVSVSGGVQCELWDESGVARPPPLDEECAYLVDRIVLSLARKHNRAITRWYRSPASTLQIAQGFFGKYGTREQLYGLMDRALRRVKAKGMLQTNAAIISILGS